MTLLLVTMLAAPATFVLAPLGRAAVDSPRLRADRRLERPVTWSGVARLDTLAREVTSGLSPAGTRISVDPGLAPTVVVGQCRDAPVARVMEALEFATNAEWRSTRGAWVLTRSPGLETLMALPPEELRRRCEDGLRTLRVLTPAQAARLARGGALLPADLTAGQRRGLLTAIQCEYLRTFREGDRTIQLSPEALQLQEVYLKLQNGGTTNDSPLREIGVFAPSPYGDDRSFTEIDTRLTNVGHIEFPLPPRQLMPSLVGSYSPSRSMKRSLGEEKTYREDAKLDRAVHPKEATVAEVVHAVVRDTEADLLLTTVFAKREVQLPQETPTAREAFQAIERATGGSWRRVDGLYVLQPNPTLERIAQVGEMVRRRWIWSGPKEVQRLIGRREREQLQASGKLLPRHLSPQQREALRWAAHVAFALLPDIDPQALTLHGVEIALQTIHTPTGDRQQLAYLFPTVTGEKRELTALPLE
jgi:hypothetical protein